jgi:Uma2 family endonuclease
MRADIKVTYAEYRELPETGPKYQLVEGELCMSPAPNLRHQLVVGNLYAALRHFVLSCNLGTVVLAPIDIILSDENVLQPDIAYISAAHSSILVPEGVRGAPELCVEVLSERTRSLDMGIKRTLYARHGVTEYWAVDPDAKTLDLFRLQDDPTKPARTFAGAETLASPMLGEFALYLKEIFVD